VLRGSDELEGDGEAVGELQRSAVLEVGSDLFLVYPGLHLVGQQDHDHVRALYRGRDVRYLQAVSLYQVPGFPALARAYGHLHSGVVQAQCLGPALVAVSDDGDLLAPQYAEVSVGIMIDLGHFYTLI
jgi:hypothetical protein